MASPESIEKLYRATIKLEEDVEEGLKEFNEIILSAGSKMRKEIWIDDSKVANNKWFDKECREQKKLARQALQKLRRIDEDKRPNKYNESKENYKQLRANYQNLIKRKKKEYKEGIYESLLEPQRDSSKFWSTIRGMGRNRPKMPFIPTETWHQHFQSVLNPRLNENEQVSPPVIRLEPVISDDSLDKQITFEEVDNAIKNLKSRKAAGLDQIPPEFLKAAGREVITFLVRLFNRVYDSGSFPSEWSNSIIVPIFKKGEKDDPSNFRGISLLDITSKVFTAILTARITEWAELNGKLAKEQAGFRKGYSTVDHIFTLSQMASNCVFGRRRSKLYALFVDFEKAFDSINRNKLWEILHKQGVSTRFIKMLQGIYTKVNAKIRNGNELSEDIDCPFGLKQGCRLSPILFSMLINEVAENLNRHGNDGYQFLPGTPLIKLLMFADDLGLLGLTPGGLQLAINILERVTAELGLKINLAKTKVVVFRRGGFWGQREFWTIRGERVQVLNSYKYLGYPLTTKLSGDIALSEYVGRAKGKAVAIFKTLKSIGRVDIDILFKLFDSQVAATLTYASQVWGLTPFENIESVHLYVCKKILGVRKKTPNCMVYGELGRFPLALETKIQAIKYWFKLNYMEEDRLPKLAMLREMNENGKVGNWVEGIRDLLYRVGFGYVWEDMNSVTEGYFIRDLRLRLQYNYRQEWAMKCGGSGRIATYYTFKRDFCREPYLKFLTLPKFRFALARLRLSANYLNINRKYIDPRANTKCPFCRNEESEMHFLLFCHRYKDLRKKYIEKHFRQDTFRNLTLSTIVNNENQAIMTDVSMYICYAFDQRFRALNFARIRRQN